MPGNHSIHHGCPRLVLRYEFSIFAHYYDVERHDISIFLQHHITGNLSGYTPGQVRHVGCVIVWDF